MLSTPKIMSANVELQRHTLIVWIMVHVRAVDGRRRHYFSGNSRPRTKAFERPHVKYIRMSMWNELQGKEDEEGT